MFCTKPSSSKDKEARTSREEEVTPPLLALASLKRIHPAASRRSLASWVMKRLAPSTMYGIVDLWFLINLLTLERSIDSGRPPQGTKEAVNPVSRRWKGFRK